VKGMLVLGYCHVIFPLKVRSHLTKCELSHATKVKGNALLAVIMGNIPHRIVCDLSDNKQNTLAYLSVLSCKVPNSTILKAWKQHGKLLYSV
jgi:hypothetical protein